MLACPSLRFSRGYMENHTYTNPVPHTEKNANLLDFLRRDVRSALERDPAARSTLEIVLSYPGLHALWGHRIAHWFWQHGHPLVGRLFSQVMRGVTGIEIHPGATIGQGLFIDHGMGVVIGETAEIGKDVTLYHGVTLGGTRLEKGKRHPTLDDRVGVAAGAKILGAITIGSDTRIGANAVVVKSVPENSVVVGVPGQNIVRSNPHHANDLPDLNHTLLPDLVGVSLLDLMQRVQALEEQVDGHESVKPHIHAPDNGTWNGEDFSI